MAMEPEFEIELAGLKAGADAGDTAALVGLGLRYLFDDCGLSEEEQDSLGLACLERAAAAGSERAEFELGKIYSIPVWVRPDEAKAVRHLRRCVALGGENSRAARETLGVHYPATFKGDMEAAADAGDLEALLLLADAYAKGRFLLPQVPELAASYFARASDLGSAEADVRLGGAYLNGFGVTADRRKAEECWKRAAANTANPRAAEWAQRELEWMQTPAGS